MVPQCCRHVLPLLACPGLRAGVQLAPDLVREDRHNQEYPANDVSAELEMTVNMLIQIDKLVQLLESPVFTCMSRPPYVGV